MSSPGLFADAFYWVALLSPRDPFHAQVMAWDRNLGTTWLITTYEVLTEVLNWFSGAGHYWRTKAAIFVHDLRRGRGRATTNARRLRRCSCLLRGPARQGI